MNLLEILNSNWLILIIALILDLMFGDPEYKYHPIRLMGNLIYKSEVFFRKLSSRQKVNGGFFWFFIVLITGSIGYGVSAIHPIFSIYIAYSCLSVKDLKEKTFAVKEALLKDDISLARKELSMIVGRETDKLDEKEISRAAIETISENIVDGIISPIFFFMLGGAPLMLVYKAVNTLDSMVGYKNEKYIDFGFIPAKLDDLFNFIPARLSYIIISFAGLITGYNFANGVKIGLRDGQKNPSPNSGISEAIVSGLLGIQLGGTNYYHGKKIDKPTIGDRLFDIQIHHIDKSIQIAYASSILLTIVSATILFYIQTV